MFANLSGYLPGLLIGMTGTRLGYGAPETWPARSVTLPAGWKAIRVERLWIRGQPWTLEACEGAPAAIRPSR
jgi:hypothetical protein